MPRCVVEFAPAKINLFLHVVGRRPDGYHLLESLVTFADVGDTVTVSPAANSTLSIDGPYAASLRTDGTNIVWQATEHLSARFEQAYPVSIALTKRLPIASGIGGGSADAAAVLRALCRLWQIDAGDHAVADVARSLGADVPMCLDARPALASGIGDDLNRVDGFPTLHGVLVNPQVPISTPAIFRLRAGSFTPPLNAIPRFMTRDSVIAFLHTVGNDLEAPALRLAPVIGEMLTLLRSRPQCRLARMSGSGATCFALTESANDAKDLADTITDVAPTWWVRPVRLNGSPDPHHANRAVSSL